MIEVNINQGKLGKPITPKPQTVKAIEELMECYPVREAALIPAMHLLQEDIRWMPLEAMDWIAEKLELPKVRVYGVASFYTMFRRKPVGRLRLEVCTNLSCSLMGATHLLDYLCAKLGIKPGETTEDGLVTLTEVECLGSCGTAPVMLVNDKFYENLTPRKIDALLERIQSNAAKAKGGDNG